MSTTNHKLQISINLLLKTFETANYGILILDEAENIVGLNQHVTDVWQIYSAFLLNKNINFFFDLILDRLAEPFTCELNTQSSQSKLKKHSLLKLKNGKTLECHYQVQMYSGKNVGCVWGFREINKKDPIQTAIQPKVQHDTLTKLPKRTVIICQLSQAITEAESNYRMLAVMLVDLDRFKLINDTLGHKAGDRLIQQVVQRLKNCIRGKDVMARWGGDEFTLLLPQINNKADVDEIATRILNVLKSPFHLENQLVHITSSVGIAIYPEHGADAETLLKNADAALSQAKRKGRNNYKYYNSAFNSQGHQRLALENLLRSALQKKEFFLYYQPIVNITTGKIVKMEALLRWQNPQLGFVPPYVFIPIAEENGTIVPIGEWVLETACLQNKLWQSMNLSPIQISVNLSVRQFQQTNLILTINRILQQTQLNSSYLELEITESITMQDTETAKITLEKLEKMGISLSMDDFGTGYSSLSYLKQFPFHTLKIDRSFIKDLQPGSQDIAIVNAIIALGKGLDLNVVAEGIETKELNSLLKSLGCEYIQGYLFSKPLPAVEATKLLQQYNIIVFMEHNSERHILITN